jgi:hypothetical protein
MTGVNYAVYTAGTPLLTKKLVFHEKRSNRGLHGSDDFDKLLKIGCT